MKARIKATGEVLRVLDLDSERILIKYGSEVKSLCIHEVDLISGSVEDYYQREINWEQRRYEIAKEAMGALISSPSYQFYKVNNYYEVYIEPSEEVAKDAVKYADALIEELKGGKQ